MTVNFEVHVKVWSRPSCDCGILYLKFNGVGLIIEITKLFIYIAERVINGLGYLLFVLPVKPIYEVCLVRIKEQVGERKNTVCTHRYASGSLYITCFFFCCYIYKFCIVVLLWHRNFARHYQHYVSFSFPLEMFLIETISNSKFINISPI